MKLLRIVDFLKLKLSIKRGLKLGKNCRLMKGINFGSEPFLISISDEVTVSFDVTFITHDGATWVFRDKDSSLTKFGYIKVEERAFIGAKSILLPGVTVGKRSVVAAGSVVTRSIPPGEVWGGNPARFICSVDDYYEKTKLLEQNKNATT
ncbi:acyltransferase [Vibrio parahaemolyticus]|nr:hypothetical protein [Vibrio parahaemolyticus]EHZ2782103.1 acyltransferase [Vibrio parahaemolyticus]EJG1816713.1 acyltransferase [Vibrio parahaemolyticus]EJY0700463.1 acyltransferase [Vibrio parahaemolyticus]EKG2653954.1 acyltransferase [Vibrio parahaemolyticus]